MNRIVLTSLIALTCCVLGCEDDAVGDNDVTFAATQPRDVIVTTTAPLAWMAKQVVGDSIPVEFPVPPDVDVSQWEPESAAIDSFQTAGLIVTNGAGLEKWVVKTTLPTSRLVDTTAGLSEPFIRYENVVIHKHGPGGDQSFEGVDPHTWLDPVIAKHQASRIAEAAIRRWPERKEAFGRNLKVLHQQLDGLDEAYRSLVAKMKSIRIVSSHPAHNYLARRYQWNYHNVDLEDGQPITEAVLKKLPGSDQFQGTTIVFHHTGSDSLDQVGFKPVLFESGEAAGSDFDFIDTMTANLERLSAAIQ